MFGKRLLSGIIVFIVIACVYLVNSAYQFSVENPTPVGTVSADAGVILDESRVQHILYGDMRGGGHKFGVGKPCKSEFPQGWDDDKIIDVTRKIAANDNLP